MTTNKVKKIYLIVLAIYVALVTSFYFIAGEQLWYKESKAQIEMLEADSISEEINKENTITSVFNNPTDRLESIDFIFTKNYQEGSGTLTIEVYQGNKKLGNLISNVKSIPEQSKITLTFDEPTKDLKGKEIEIIISATSEAGEGVCAMMNSTDTNTKVNVNGKTAKGSLCLSVVGSDEISLASYYWFIMGGIGLAIAIALFISYSNFIKGKVDFITASLINVDKYKFLIGQLVSRDFKSKYKRSVFGVFWSFLNPLLTMIVQFLVFSTFFKADTKNYPVYLISGVICFSFFNECSTMCLNSISGNYNLITKVYIPKYIFPLAKTMSSSVNLAISLIPLLLVALVTGTTLHVSVFLMFYFLICLIIFSLGVGMVLATLMVFFRDIQFLWSVVCTIWQYATPIFYPAEIIPERFRFIVRFNPLYHFIGCVRKCLIDGVSPEPIQYVYCFIFAIVSLGIGSYIFKKCQDKFTLYL